MVDEYNLEKMHFSSEALDKELSEAEVFEIDTEVINSDYPPMIKGVSVAYFCSFNQEIDLGGGSTIPLVLNVNKIFVDDKNIVNKEKLIIKFNPVARVGGSYAFLGKDIDAPVTPKN